MDFKRLQFPQVLAVSFYLALIVVFEEELKVGSAFLGALGRPFSGWLYPFLTRITHTRHQLLFLYLVFCWVILGLIVFCALRAVLMSGKIRRPVLAISAIVTVAAFPVTWLRLGNLTKLDTAEGTQLLWETVVVCVCALLFFIRAWSPTVVIVACAVATAHFVLWFWITRNSLTAELSWVILILGVLSTIACGQLFVSHKQKATG